MADNLDLALGGLEDGLKRARTLVFTVEENAPDQLFRECGILHRGVWIADRDAAPEKRSRAVLNVLHLLKLRDEIGSDKPTVSGVRFGETKLLEVPKPGHLCRARRSSGIFVHWVRVVRNRSTGQPTVQGSDPVCG